MFSLDKKRWQWVAMIFLAFIWGGSFILMKKGLLAFSYTQVASIRIFFGALVMLPFSIRSIKKLNKQNTHFLAISGLLGNFFPAFLFTFAQTNIPSSVAGILNSLTPFFTLTVGILLFKNKPGILQYLGIFIGLLGAVLLISNGNFTSFSDINYYALFIVLATFFYGINGNLIHSKLGALNGIEITSLAFMFVGPLAGIVLFSTDFGAAFQSQFFWESLIATLTLSIFGSVLSLFVFNNLIMHTGAIFASSVTYIIPVFALMWGLFDGEVLSLLQGLSMLIIIVGVYLANKKKRSFKIIDEG
jgi:drug/metabolite transporter (DMT)-like permease